MAGKSGGKLTHRQKRLIKALPTASSVAEAAIVAGYSPKQANQSGYQAIQALRGKVPELMDRLGLTEEILIDKHLRKHLTAKKVVFVREGDSTNRYSIDDNQTQMKALEQSFLLHGSYAPKEAKEAASFGVKVVVLDMPRPNRTIQAEVVSRGTSDED